MIEDSERIALLCVSEEQMTEAVHVAAGLPVLGGETIFDVVGNPYKIRKIRMDKHCYACTAGAGSS